MDRLLPAITAHARRDLLAPAGILARNDPKVRALEGLRADGRGAARRRSPTRSSCAKGPSSTTSICERGRRPGCFSISARTARPRRATRADGCSTASATTAASRCGWRGSVRRPRRSTSRRDAVARIRANAVRNGVPHAGGARGQRLRRAAAARAGGRALRHDRARPAGVREEQGVGSERAGRLQGDQPARDAAARRRAATSSPAAARTTSTKRCSGTCCTRRRSTATRR